MTTHGSKMITSSSTSQLTQQLDKQRHQNARIRFTPKEKRVEIYGWIYDVLYGKFATNTKSVKMGTFAIVELRVLKSDIRDLQPKSRVIVKGDFPYQSCYFKYKLSCLPVWDEKDSKWIYELHDIIKVERDSVMTARALEWIALRELKAQKSLFDSILDDLIPGIPHGRITSNTPVNMATQKTRHWFWEKSYPTTEWYRWDHDKILSNLFPGGTNTLFNDVYSSIVVPAIVNLTKDENESWRLCFKQTCRNIAPYMKDFSYRVSKENRGPLVMKPEYADAIDFYFECIKNHRKKNRSTSFRVTRPEDLVKAELLCRPMGMLVKEKIHEEIFYTFKKDYDVQCELISIYNAIWSNEVDKIVQLQQSPEKHSKSSTVKSFKRNNAQIVVKRDYVPTPTLTPDQMSAIEAVSKKPIVNVVGLPGRGKSIVIREIFKKYEHVFVVTRLAAMAAELKESFGIATEKVTTTESAICRHKIDVYKKELADVRILVIDEYEDLDDKSILSLLKGPFSNIVRIVHVFDPEQIRPIKPGSMAQDFLFATGDSKPKHRSGFKGNSEMLDTIHKLTTPWRFQSAFARKTDENDKAIIEKKWEDVDFKRFNLNDLKTTICDWNIEKEMKFSRCGYPTFSFPSSSTSNNLNEHVANGNDDDVETQNTLRRIMSSMDTLGIFDDVETFGSFVNKKNVVPAGGTDDATMTTTVASRSTDSHAKRADFQCIALRKKSVDTLNAFFEKKYNPNGYAFYSGQRVIVDGTNFNQTKPLLFIKTDPKKRSRSSLKTVKENATKTKKTIDDEGLEKNEQRKDTVSPFVAVASKHYAGGPDHDHCDVFKNGETCIVDYIVDFDATIYTTNAIRMRWKKETKRQHVSVDDIVRYDFTNTRRCVVMTNGKIMCIHPSYVEKMHVLPAWAITVDKSKGRTFGNVIFAVGGEKDTVFTKNHVHVALTRAKGLTMIAGDLSVLKKIVLEEESRSNDSNRLHLMRWRLKKWWRKEAGRGKKIAFETTHCIEPSSFEKEDKLIVDVSNDSPIYVASQDFETKEKKEGPDDDDDVIIKQNKRSRKDFQEDDCLMDYKERESKKPRI